MYQNMILYKDKLIVFGYKITYLEKDPIILITIIMIVLIIVIDTGPHKYEPAYSIVDTNSMEILKSEN